MSDLTKSLDSLVADMGDAARKEISGSLRPVLKKLSDALEELEAKLDAAEKGATRGRKKRGRPAGSGRKKAAKRGAKRGSKRTPRGALQSAIKDALGGGKSLKLSQIRDSVLKQPLFKGRDPKTLYTMIVLAVKKMPEVSKTSAGTYKLGAKGSGPAKKAKATRKKKK
jgi:hypothetical protein